MSANDAAYAGSIPGIYDRHLAALLFEPYAREMARRATEGSPESILETAAGTGLVTAHLEQSCPKAPIVATDLNADMLAVARSRVSSGRVECLVADAQQLPSEDGTFDLVVSQFGLMFYPDKVAGNAEARRVLRDGGRYLFAVWDRIENNAASLLVHETVASLFPDDPPGFLARGPYGYADRSKIESDLRAAGFDRIAFDTVRLNSDPGATIEDAAIGLVLGCPLKAEIEQRDPSMLDQAVAACTDALRQLQRGDGIESPLSAHVVTAVK